MSQVSACMSTRSSTLPDQQKNERSRVAHPLIGTILSSEEMKSVPALIRNLPDGVNMICSVEKASL